MTEEQGSEHEGTDFQGQDIADAGGGAADLADGLLVKGAMAVSRAHRIEKYGTDDPTEAAKLRRAGWGKPRRILYASVLPVTFGVFGAVIGGALTGSPLGGLLGFLVVAGPPAWFLIRRTLREHAEEAELAVRLDGKLNRRQEQMAWMRNRETRES